MSLQVVYPHITRDEGQAARLEKHPRIRVAQIVMDYLTHGWSAEEMCRQHPYLTPAEAHAAMVYYYDHQAEIDGEIQEEIRDVEEARRRTIPTPVLLRLQGMSQAKKNPGELT